MCCGDAEVLDLPPAVIEMLARYRRLSVERGWDWGDDRIDMFRWARFAALGDVFAAYGATGDWLRAVRDVVGSDPPSGVAVVRVRNGGITVHCGPPRPVVAGVPMPLDVVVDVDSAADREVAAVVAGDAFTVAAGGAGVSTVDVDGPPDVTIDGEPVSLAAAVSPTPEARLRLRAQRCARWSVTDATGGAWFPDGVLRKWDVRGRPFFHADDVTLTVPSTTLTVTCTRGLEFDVVERTVTGDALVEVEPQRRFDPAADGWYGGDLHVHMNYSGDLVCTPADVARMQRGEGLHLANLTAGNLQTSLVYDRELLEEFAGVDLPWSDGEFVARPGVEYRNDLLGHVHALGPDGPPSRYYAGHERTDHPEDWPPNQAACAELRALSATVGYPHPVFAPFGDDGGTEAFFANPRSVEARELVVDAALGLVDSLDLLSPFDDEAAVYLYHRLLSCGLRLTATAGTDVFLSFSHGPGVASNPPGWARVYAHLGDAPLSVPAFKEAVRAGRTVVTNGPWLTFDVAGRGPGAVIDAAVGDRLTVTADAIGVDRLTIVGPDGVLGSGGGLEYTVDGPTWLAAVARGPATGLAPAGLAHTTPVYVDVDGVRVARAGAAEWCLGLVDGLERLLAEHGVFADGQRERRLADYAELLETARRFYREAAERARRADIAAPGGEPCGESGAKPGGEPGSRPGGEPGAAPSSTGAGR